MKLGLKTIVLALVVALLCVPAAFAKGHEGGHGHGKPSWAGQGKSHEKKAKPDKAVKHAAKAKHQKHQKAGSEDAVPEDELNLDDLNPSWYCKTLESMMDATDAEAAAGGTEAGEFSSFDAEFGTNDNKRNSHGKCVSRRAHGEDLSGALDDEAQQPCDDPADDGSEDPADDGSEDPATGEGTDTSGADEGTDTSAADDPAADDPADDGSGDQAGEAEDCQSDDSAGEDDQADQADDDDQGEDSDAQGDEDDQGAEAEVAAFARALVRFIEL
jgi:hypothetical protein